MSVLLHFHETEPLPKEACNVTLPPLMHPAPLAEELGVMVHAPPCPVGIHPAELDCRDVFAVDAGGFGKAATVERALSIVAHLLDDFRFEAEKASDA